MPENQSDSFSEFEEQMPTLMKPKKPPGPKGAAYLYPEIPHLPPGKLRRVRLELSLDPETVRQLQGEVNARKKAMPYSVHNISRLVEELIHKQLATIQGEIRSGIGSRTS